MSYPRVSNLTFCAFFIRIGLFRRVLFGNDQITETKKKQGLSTQYQQKKIARQTI